MKRTWPFIAILCCLLMGCGNTSSAPEQSETEAVSETPSQPVRDNTPVVLLPDLSGDEIFENELASFNTSHKSDGYIIANYQGSASLVKLYLTIPDGTKFPYLLTPGEDTLIPLTGGNGAYQAVICEHVTGEQYAVAFSQDIDVTLENEFLPFLYPNQFAAFSEDSACVAKGQELAKDTYSGLEVIQNVYYFVTENIDYDKEKAELASAGTLFDFMPDADATLESQKGICFDFASLMCSMLRSQQIPTKLQIGYAGDVYHAWISTYIEEIGWIDNVIEFDGKSWKLMDPTFASSNGIEETTKYIGDGSNYTTKYSY